MTPTVTKRAAETRAFEVNLGPRMRPTDSIDAVTEITAGSDSITIDQISISSAIVVFRVAGGAPGARYPLTIRFTTTGSPPQSLEAVVHLDIIAGP